MLIHFAAYGYLGLFLSSFLAATILPMSSEVVFTALFYGGLAPWKLVFVATVGNWLGGLTCYWLGHLGKLEWIEKWFKIPKSKVDKFAAKFNKYGDWLSFFSFLPFIGDPIAVAAGFLRTNFIIAAFSMLLGKFFRYVVWMYLNGFILNS